MIIIIITIALIHIIYITPSEKLLTQYIFGNSKAILRPKKVCTNNYIFNCLGMPSGHCEVTTIIVLLSYFLKYIPLYIALLIMTGVGIQRIYTKMHTLLQVVFGYISGIIYTFLYLKIGINLDSLIVSMLIGLVFRIMSLNI